MNAGVLQDPAEPVGAAVPARGEPSAFVDTRYLDGIRALAACFVLVHHAVQFCGLSGFFASYGWAAVDVFFVLSGLVLALPAVSNGGRLRGGFWSYAVRRAKRILPPYYASCVFAILLLALVPAQARYASIRWPVAPDDAAAHLMLVHNLRTRWSHGINPVLWTVAYEWQLYFFLPLVFLPVLRKVGAGALVAGCFLVAIAPRPIQLQQSVAMFAGVFACGIAAAEWMRGTGRRDVLLLCLFATGAAVAASRESEVLSHMAVGLGAAASIVALDSGRLGPLRKLLESKPLEWIAGFSYSLYLLHVPFLAALIVPAGARFEVPSDRLAAIVLIGFPLIFGFSYLFSLVFERPFRSRPRPQS